MKFRPAWCVFGLVLALALEASAIAAPRRIMVLPLDGNAEGVTRARLNATVQKLAKATPDAVVTIGDATFEETAAAVGCVATVPSCPVSVRTTLGVDELVYGTVTTNPSGQTTLVLRRSSATDNPPRETTTVLAQNDPPDRAERELAPVFGRTTAAPDPGVPVEPVKPVDPGRPVDHRKRNIGIACTTGGGVLVLIGGALLASYLGAQQDIDNAPTRTVAELRHLQDLEDRAQRDALLGDVMVLGGLALAAYGGWVLYKDHEDRQFVVTPVATPTGPAVVLGGSW